MNREEMKKSTDEAINDPQVGDRFHEMYSYWVYVVKVTKKFVWTMHASPPCEFPKDGKLIKRKREDFKKYYEYGSIAGCWVDLSDRGNDVKGWMDVKRA